jgi:hypothetical protein
MLVDSNLLLCRYLFRHNQLNPELRLQCLFLVPLNALIWLILNLGNSLANLLS